jgi:hypothetical protein
LTFTEARLDDRVNIQLGAPQSKRKSFYLTKILSRGSSLVSPASTPLTPGAVSVEESEILKQVNEAEKLMGQEGRDKKQRRRTEEEREKEALRRLGIQADA